MKPTAEQRNEWHSPFDAMLGVVVDDVSPERVVVRLSVREHLHQPTGVVHGGVYATLAEGAAGIGATLWLASQQPGEVRADRPPAFAVGVSNHTDFFRSVSDGQLVATATPLQRGRRMQVWEIAITANGDDRLVAHGKVRLVNLGEAG